MTTYPMTTESSPPLTSHAHQWMSQQYGIDRSRKTRDRLQSNASIEEFFTTHLDDAPVTVPVSHASIRSSCSSLTPFSVNSSVSMPTGRLNWSHSSVTVDDTQFVWMPSVTLSQQRWMKREYHVQPLLESMSEGKQNGRHQQMTKLTSFEAMDEFF